MPYREADVFGLGGAGADASQPLWMTADCSHYTCHVARDAQAPAGFAYRKLRAVLAELGEHGALAGRAFQVSEWIRTHRYCGVCATPMRKSETELCFHCPACGYSAYPRISPAMMEIGRASCRERVCQYV